MREFINKVNSPTIYGYTPDTNRSIIMANGLDPQEVEISTELNSRVGYDIWEIHRDADLQELIPAFMLNLMSDRIMESRSYSISINDGLPIRILKNPSAKQLEQMNTDLRCIIEGSDLYVWDAYFGTHYDVANEMVLHPDYELTFHNGVFNWETDEEALNHPTVKRAFPNASIQLTEASRPKPSNSAIKFWITPTGEIDYFDEDHHFTYLTNRDITWGQAFDEGYVRGFVEESEQIINLDYDQRKITPRIKRAILKLISAYRPIEIIEDETRHGAYYGSERLSTREYIEILRNMGTGELTEAPIADITHVGNWEKNSSFRDPRDRKLLTSVKALDKIKTMWKYPEDEDYNIILLNHPEGHRYQEMGFTDIERLPGMFGKTWDQIEPMIKDDQINIIYTNNSGSERVPMTGWIMAHRMGHALYAGRGRSYYMEEACQTLFRYLKDYTEEYGFHLGNQSTAFTKKGPLMALLYEVCTFKGARERNMRNVYEVFFDLFAQYIFRGKLIFNPLPRSFRYGNTTYSYQGDDLDFQHWNNSMDDLNYELSSMFDTAIRYSVGKVLVM
jgi:hypothetical protein